MSSSSPPPVPGADRLADHWGVILAYGLVSIGLGLVLAVWPDETLVVCAVLIAIQILVSGVLRIVVAVGARGLDGGVRALHGLIGGLAIIVGLLFLRDPVQTLLVIGILLGVWWVISGVIDVVGALVSPVHERRVWDLVTGAISILAGGFLLVNPKLSLGVLVVVICVWLFAIGGIAVASALVLRSDRHRRSTGAAGPTTAPAG
ncbi:MAG TPA: DUF308 domain-containing protein [Nocardioides sp.]|uniref:HdeD family acid-resistance protein n=1 Tax=Nocardioides sp. TaxID=35761 RepID=UPI002E2ED13B|nr:DUF308 domain-containing protein [Nocardioides sp.]HEX5087925.1 DUF308 domain-containing protein [Nocardioides sp.]